MLKTSIPFVDLRGKTPIDLLRAYPDKAHALVSSARRSLGKLPYSLPLADKRWHAWLKRNANPYLYEIESFNDILATPGMYTLNASSGGGCTGGVYRTDHTVSMLRVLDLPFAGMGKQLMVALQEGKAGEFYNITWPGLSGVTTAMAPQRFAAAINSAPMRRHNLGPVGDRLKNRFIMRRQTGLPPTHLLRRAFEQAANYEAAKHMLATTPVAEPVIYILAGLEPGQGCIIERLETSADITELSAGHYISATNHFNGKFATAGKGWQPRFADSRARYRQSCTIQGYDLRMPNFDWLQAPVINQFTRLCAITDAATGRLTLQGYEGVAQVTELFDLPYTQAMPDFEMAASSEIHAKTMTFAPAAEVM
jgi:hypothetical protein